MGLVMRQVIEGLGHVAKHRIAHMDVKPENVLVSFVGNSLQVKLCDFGLCALLPPNSTILSEFCGSPGFFAPEVYMQKKFWLVHDDHSS